MNFDFDNLGQYKTINRYSDLAGTQLVVGTNYTYDGKNRLDVLSHHRGGGAIASYDFDYDNADRITRINSLVDGVTNYTYDNTNQLRIADHNIAANPDESYTYDANGNRINTTGSRGNRSYTTPSLSDNRLQSDGVFNYQYDNEGNLVRKTEIATGKVSEYSWDYLNRLVWVTDRNSQAGAAVRNVGFTYDAMGHRISKSVDNNPADTIEGAVTYFVYDRDHVILDFVDSDGRSGANVPVQSRRYLFGNNTDQILSQEDGTGANVNWTLTDHLGTVKDLVNNSGTVVNHLTYDSFGNVVSQSNAAVDTRYRFTGREFDGETGLYYYRARYYDAGVGRFIGTDPIGFEGGDSNLYRYGKNSPIDTTDPLGLWGWVRNQSRQISYEDNGTKYANDIDDVRKAYWQNPTLSITSDVTLAFIVFGWWKTGTETTRVKPPHFIDRIDNRGHIVGSQLGGSGHDVNNLFSQNRRWNQFWKTFENSARQHLDAANTVPVCPPPSVGLTYIVSLQYEPRSLRPSTYSGRAVFSDGHDIVSDIYVNPKK